MNFYDNNVKVENLREVVRGNKICYDCGNRINPSGTMSPIWYCRITAMTGRIEVSHLVHESCFKDGMEKSLGKHISFIPAKILDLSSII